MLKLFSFFSAGLFLSGILISQIDGAEAPLAQSTIVVYNQSDKESTALAKFYTQQRGIARDHLVGLDCATDEDVSRDDYEATIAQPLRDAFKERPLVDVSRRC